MLRREALKVLAGLPVALAGAAMAAPAWADTSIVQNNSGYTSTYTAGSNQPWTGWISSGGVGYAYAYLFGAPTSEIAVQASIPVNTPVSVVGYSPGEELAPNNPLWYNISSPQGWGWVYSGLVTFVQPVLQPASAVALPPGPIPGPTGSGKSISISLSRQHLWAYEGAKSVLDVDITTGAPDKPTPPGSYSVFSKIPNFKFISPWPAGSPFWYPDSPTHYAMEFLWGGYYIHDAPWRPYYGPGTNLPHLDPDGTVRAGSHGCVNTQLATINFLSAWTPLGTPVLIIN